MRRCFAIFEKAIASLDQTDAISQGELAKKLGCSRLTINELAQGKRGIGPSLALKFEKVFGIPAEEIVTASALDLLDKEREKTNAS